MTIAARRYSDLAVVLVGRDLRVSYGNAALGLLWAPLEALVQVAVLSFLFVRVVPLDIPDYVAFVFTGVTVWQLMSSSLVHGTEAFTGNRDLVRRPGFPTPLLPVHEAGARRQAAAQGLRRVLVPHRHQVGLEPPHLLRQEIEIGPCRQRGHPEAFGLGGDALQGARPDGPGGPEDGQGAHEDSAFRDGRGTESSNSRAPGP